MSFSTFQTQVPHPTQQQQQPQVDLDSLFQSLSLKPTPAADPATSTAGTAGSITPSTSTTQPKPLIPPPSYYDFLLQSQSSEFIYFTRLETTEPKSTSTTTTQGTTPFHAPPQQEYYLPLFTDHYYTLLHEISNMYDLEYSVESIQYLSLRAEGVESDGRAAELELGLEGIRGEMDWETAKRRLGEMGFGRYGSMGEGVVLIVGVMGGN